MTGSKQGFRPHVTRTATGVPGRKGSAWNDCRRRVIARSGGVCAICGRPLVPSAKPPNPMTTEVDHYPTPYRKMRRALDAGEITWDQFAAMANDPDRCRAVHRVCHEDSGTPAEIPAGPPLRHNDDGTVTGPTSREW